jgi:hypothetical protein
LKPKTADQKEIFVKFSPGSMLSIVGVFAGAP